jgi:hypothetical protein
VQIQRHLPVENIVDRHRRGHDRQPRRTGLAGASGQRRTAIAAASNRSDSTQADHHLGGQRRSLISGLLMGGEDPHVPLAMPSIMAHALLVFMIA